MKRVFITLLAALLLLSLCAPCLAEDSLKVQRTNQALEVNGASVQCEIYNINDSNYFKLRDIAYLLNGTGSQFSVDYDTATRQMRVTTGQPYTPVGGELEDRGDYSAETVASTQQLVINGTLNGWISAYNIGGNNFFKLRDLGENLGFSVNYDPNTRTMLVTSSGAASEETLRYELVTYGGVTADVLYVNVKNPRVRVEADMVSDTVAARKSFAEIVSDAAGAKAVITGNFMNGDSEGNYPVGHVMCDGVLRYIGSGFTSFGITDSGEVRVGRPSIRIRMKTLDRSCNYYTAVALNLRENEQASQGFVLYDSAFGTDFEVCMSGGAATVSGGRVQSWQTVSGGERLAIPADGYVLILSEEYMRDWVYDFQPPQVGERVELEYFLYKPDEEGFTLDGVKQIISGAPRLVKNGAAETAQEAQFSGDRFTDTYSAPRTAMGVTADGTLVFVSTGGATIPQLRELMLHLSCTDAVNLDGGASTGLWYNGKTYRTPGRHLATTVSIYVDP